MDSDRTLSTILLQFNLKTEPSLLPGGSQATFRVNDVVLKRVKETSLENNHSPKLMAWIAQFSKDIHETGFRIPNHSQPLTGVGLRLTGGRPGHFWRAGTLLRMMCRHV